MDALMSPDQKPVTFNGPLEAGIRAVSILGAAYPQAYDLQRLVAFDYLLVHTADVGGPESLHPPTPMHSAELLVRRKLVEQALLLMMTRDLVQRDITPDGFKYCAGENAETFLASLTSAYLSALKERAAWLIGALGSYSQQCSSLAASVETWKNPRRVLNPLCTLQHGEIAPFWMHEAWLEAMRRIVDLLDTLTAAPAEALESQ